MLSFSQNLWSIGLYKSDNLFCLIQQQWPNLVVLWSALFTRRLNTLNFVPQAVVFVVLLSPVTSNLIPACGENQSYIHSCGSTPCDVFGYLLRYFWKNWTRPGQITVISIWLPTSRPTPAGGRPSHIERWFWCSILRIASGCFHYQIHIISKLVVIWMMGSVCRRIIIVGFIVHYTVIPVFKLPVKNLGPSSLQVLYQHFVAKLFFDELVRSPASH